MDRLTERDEFGNADIIGVDSEDLQLNLDFDGFNRVTDALNNLAAYEDTGRKLRGDTEVKKYIECEAAVNEVGRWLGYLDEDMILRIQIGVKKIPAADVRENVHGEWMINTTAAGRHYTSCSICSNVLFVRTDDGASVPLDIRNSPFCPVCGAAMRKGAQR